MVAVILIAQVPPDLQRRLAAARARVAWAKRWRSSRPCPRPRDGIRTAWTSSAHPGHGWLAMLGSIGFWASERDDHLGPASNRSGSPLPLGEVVVGFFVGMVANLAPAPAGVGAVDGGLIGVFAHLRLPRSRW